MKVLSCSLLAMSFDSSGTFCIPYLHRCKIISWLKGLGNGKLFGSVSTKEIAAACEKQLGLEIDKKKMVLPEPIKACGTTIVPVKLHREVTAKLTVKVQEA